MIRIFKTQMTRDQVIKWVPKAYQKYLTFEGRGVKINAFEVELTGDLLATLIKQIPKEAIFADFDINITDAMYVLINYTTDNKKFEIGLWLR